MRLAADASSCAGCERSARAGSRLRAGGERDLRAAVKRVLCNKLSTDESDSRKSRSHRTLSTVAQNIYEDGLVFSARRERTLLSTHKT